jgi:ribosome biogenesis protein BMS1
MKPRTSKKLTYSQKRAVVLEPHEKHALRLMQQIQTLKKEKERKRKEKEAKRKLDHAKAVLKEESRLAEKKRLKRKEFFRTQGKQNVLGSGPEHVRKKLKTS